MSVISYLSRRALHLHVINPTKNRLLLNPETIRSSPLHSNLSCHNPSSLSLKRNGIHLVAARTPIFVRSFHTTQTKNVPPIFLALIKPASRLLAALVGRRFGKWWRALPDERKTKFREYFRSKRPFLGGLGAVLVAAVAYGYFSHVTETPITKRRRFVALNQEQVEKIASLEYDQLSERFSGSVLTAQHPHYNRIVRVAHRLLKSNQDLKEIAGKKWAVTVINENDRNAFVLPTGQIFVFTGMLEVCTNDDQLGIILGHEISHTVLGHAGENLSHANLLSSVLMVPLAVLWAFLPNDGIALVADWFFHKVIELFMELPFSREMELEADEVGLQLAAKACFDVREAPALWAKMELIEKQEGTEDDQHRVIELLSTHPSNQEREKRLTSLMPDAVQIRSSCGCPTLSSIDPYEQFKKSAQKIVLQKTNPSLPEVALVVK